MAADPVPATNSTTDAVMRVIIGRWYAVYWAPTQYWYIGEALHQHESEANMWSFSFIEQTNPKANGFKPVKDIEPVSSDSVFAEMEALALFCSTRTSLPKLTRADFKTALQKFRDFYAHVHRL